MIKQTRFRKGVTAVGLLCLFGQSCGSKQVQPAHPRTASLKTSSRPPKNPYKKVKPAKMSEYLKMLDRSQASRIRPIGKEPAAEMSFEVRQIAACIEQEPENLELTKQLARVLIREGHLVEAFGTLDRVRSLPATDPEIEAGLALVWQKLGSTSSALYHAQQAVLLDRSAANLALLGKIQLQRADFGKALATLKKAHVSYPDSQGLVLALAQAAAGVSDWEAARSYFKRTLELNPESVPAREGLVTVLVRLDEVNDALTELRRLFEEGETYARLGQELMAAERWGEAQKALKKALEYFPENRELALKVATVDSYLPFPTVVFLNVGDGIAIDVQSITVQTVYSAVELRGGQVVISTPELEPGIGAGRASGGINSSVVVNLSSMDAIAELGTYSSETVEKGFFRRTVSPNVVELVELPMKSRDPVVSLARFSPASPVNLPAGRSISPGLHEVSEPAPAPGWDGDELAQHLLSRNFQVIQLVNGTVVASDESRGVVLNDSEPFEFPESVLNQVSLSALESVLDERGVSLSAEVEIVEVEVEAVNEDLGPALEAEVMVADDEDVTLHVTPEETTETPVQTAPEAPPAQVDPEMEEGSPLQPDLLCQLQGSTPASRAIPIIDSLMEEDFRQDGWTLRSDLRDGMAAESDARAMRNQPFTPWLPLTWLSVLALLGCFLRRREPVAVVLEKVSEERNTDC